MKGLWTYILDPNMNSRTSSLLICSLHHIFLDFEFSFSILKSQVFRVRKHSKHTGFH